jgi:hypothetical protein
MTGALGPAGRVYVVEGGPDGSWHLWHDAVAARLHYEVLVAANCDAELYGLSAHTWATVRRNLPDHPLVEHTITGSTA